MTSRFNPCYPWAMKEAFSSLIPLYGENTLDVMKKSRVLIIGLGGVGSWATEALCRHGIGTLSLMDLDDVCVTNINRQVQALYSTIGRPKAEVLKQRCLDISPKMNVQVIQDFYTEQTPLGLLRDSYDIIIDAIDSLAPKVHLIARCIEHQLPLITVGAAGGRRDLRDIQVQDLSKSYRDRLLFRVRKKLRREYAAFKNQKHFQIPAIFAPLELVGSLKQSDQKGSSPCDIHAGSTMLVTATMGLLAAQVAIEKIFERQR